jgi:hypothetical protein
MNKSRKKMLQGLVSTRSGWMTPLAGLFAFAFAFCCFPQWNPQPPNPPSIPSRCIVPGQNDGIINPNSKTITCSLKGPFLLLPSFPASYLTPHPSLPSNPTIIEDKKN